jgi:hypothetical protein
MKPSACSTSPALLKLAARLAVTVACAVAVAAADPIPVSKLAGKWSSTGTGPDGRKATQILEFSGDKLKYQLLDEDKQPRIHATGQVTTESAGPLNILKVTDIRGGESPDNLDPVNDDHTSVFVLDGETLTLASNFDKERDNQVPRVDVYRLMERPKADAGAGLAAKLAGRWKMKISVGQTESDYGLSLTAKEEKLDGVLISPRSGEHKAKLAEIKDGKLTLEVEREYQGNPVTLLYVAELKGEELVGTVVAKGNEEQFKGTWKATK